MEDLQDKTALVTGASAGIGKETAHALAHNGANVAVAARREGRLEDLAAELETSYDVEVLVVPTDVSKEDEVRSMIDQTVDRFGELNIVVNNAGVGGPGSIDEISTDQYRHLMGVNVDGYFYATHAAIPHLRETEGNLIFVGSFAGEYPRPGSSVYAASKWWTRGFAKSLAGNLGEEGIAVTIINPTEVRTEIAGGDSDPKIETYEPGEITEPESIAEAITFAATQSPPDSVNELNLYRRDRTSHF
jgi:NADP-dependent 3-hydroxy acid dehydrogenase YdfG